MPVSRTSTITTPSEDNWLVITDVSKPCCIEPIPGHSAPVRVLISNLGDSTLKFVDVSQDGKLTLLGKATVGKAPKRVAFIR
ncbi:MAG: hypothetical protein JWM11_5569 [Planctomycetaceae bacterium]|nr:hypothetical protein [Planctomycetaceae bacterium]